MGKQVNVLFSDSQYETFRRLAWESRISVAAVVRLLATSSSPGHVENIKGEINSEGVESAAGQGASPNNPMELDKP